MSEGKGNPLALISVLASSLVGMAWSLATFLAVPVLVTEDLGPMEALKRSSKLLKKTWGEQIVGGLSIGLVFALLGFVTLILGALAFVFLAETSPTATITIVILLVLIFLVLALISSTLSGIYSAVFYDYAVGGSFGEILKRGPDQKRFQDEGADLRRGFSPRSSPGASLPPSPSPFCRGPAQSPRSPPCGGRSGPGSLSDRRCRRISRKSC